MQNLWWVVILCYNINLCQMKWIELSRCCLCPELKGTLKRSQKLIIFGKEIRKMKSLSLMQHSGFEICNSEHLISLYSFQNTDHSTQRGMARSPFAIRVLFCLWTWLCTIFNGISIILSQPELSIELFRHKLRTHKPKI